MKKIIILLITITAFLNCKKETKKEVDNKQQEIKTENLTLLKGEFVYYADAAVLKTTNKVYGVILNKKVDELNEQAKPFKKDHTDFVLVEVKGKITPKPKDEEGWDNDVEIKEIISVSPLKTKENN